MAVFYVSQKVWCVIYGEGVVENISQEATYPIYVEFKNSTISTTYTSDGRLVKESNVTLFPHPVEIVKSVTKPSIDWSHVSEDFKYLAMDAGGLHHLYVEEPMLTSSEWATHHLYIYAGHFASFTPGACDWKDSLVKRPEQDLGERPE